jgi:CRISPR-associated endonuclease Csn1
VGRALLHIAQRRGFRSGRIEEAQSAEKADEKKKKELGQVKGKIAELPEEFKRAGASTIGEYWSKLDPNKKRIRGWGNWSSRQMHLEEFERVWERQAPCHPNEMTPAAYRMVKRRIFFQRPLKSQAGLIGSCELEPGHRRAPLAHLLYQRFRILQTVGDLRVVSSNRLARPLTLEERAKALALLSSEQTVTFASLKKALALRGERFSHEAAERKSVPGNRTGCKLRNVFGAQWDSLSESDRNEIAGCVRSMDDKDALCRLAQRRWGLDSERAGLLADVVLEQGYGALSLAALRKLVPLMEQGLGYTEALERAYPDRLKRPVKDSLPPVDLRAIRNPAVIRSLTELRKVVNAIIHDYGRPERVQIELAREMKKTAETRKKIWEENEKRRKLREQATATIFKECGLGKPSREDVDKAVLYEECHHEDPYTGASIGFCDLFGSEAKWEIEHIIPYSRCLDDSLGNKTLCDRETNRRKGNRTPFEAFGGTPEWEAMLERVKKFGDVRKRARFATEEGVEELFRQYTERQLNDTKYASRLAAEYLGLLYGGTCDELSNKRVYTVSGGVTAQIRRGWRLHSILRDGPSQSEDKKPRDDHRHHAIDALVVALTSESAVQALSRASEQARLDHRRGFRVDDPWAGFLDDVRHVVGAIKVSHRTNHRLRGALHAESIYSPERSGQGGERRHRIRKPLSSLSEAEVKEIVDNEVRGAVEEKLQEVGQRDPRKAFKNGTNLPALKNRHGEPVPIRRVRIYISESTTRVGSGATERQVVTAENHHLAIYQGADRNGAPRWTGQVVSRLEATLRKNAREEVIAPTDERAALVMALYKGDIVEMAVPGSEDGERDLFVVRGFSVGGSGEPEITATRHNLAGEIKDLKKRGEWIRVRAGKNFRRLDPRIVLLDPLGRRVGDDGQPNS